MSDGLVEKFELALEQAVSNDEATDHGEGWKNFCLRVICRSECSLRFIVSHRSIFELTTPFFFETRFHIVSAAV